MHHRLRASYRPDRAWYRIQNRADHAEVLIYDEIGEWGVTAQDFVRELQALDVRSILLRINSPGGSVFDGIAIYNALRNHSATVETIVDGLAASAASFILQAGDTRTAERTGQVMIHDAHGVALGNAGTMREMADLLDKASDNIASIYAERSGMTAEHWREEMRAERWYSSEEALAAGLVDRIAGSEAEDRPTPAPKNEVPTWDREMITRAVKEALT